MSQYLAANNLSTIPSQKKVIYDGREMTVNEFLGMCSKHYKTCDTFPQDVDSLYKA